MHFVSIQLNYAHLTQQIDVAYFIPLKMKWKVVLDRWKQSDAGKRFGMLPKDQFPMLLQTVLEEIGPNKESNLQGRVQESWISAYRQKSDKKLSAK